MGTYNPLLIMLSRSPNPSVVCQQYTMPPKSFEKLSKSRRLGFTKTPSLLGTYIRRQRLAKGWTIETLAKNASGNESRMDQSTVFRLESGAQQTAHSRTLTALANALGVNREVMLSLARPLADQS